MMSLDGLTEKKEKKNQHLQPPSGSPREPAKQLEFHPLSRRSWPFKDPPPDHISTGNKAVDRNFKAQKVLGTISCRRGSVVKGRWEGGRKSGRTENLNFCAIRLPHDLTRLEHFVPKKKKIFAYCT